ncbi:MAG: acetyl-CoA carboxylase biotin carboxyl carrier protein [Cyanobacteriota bacterium]|jgi:acetyl-CoA carboxylase biotin carboxyl carrier protein|nr:acetyl-CoA carboxylase biotin carboxyl carrier protein [Cyanobacteriota bacterium]
MQLDHDQLHRLLDRLADSDIQEFRLEGDDFRLEVRRNLPAPAAVAMVPGGPLPLAPAPVAPQGSPPPAVPALTEIPSAPPPAAAATRSDLLEITAPMVGTFYRAPAPGEPVFVDLGNRISIGQTVCIIEAMKLMNELEAEVSGEVVEILVENGTPVEFGQVLMRVRPA